MQLELGGIYEGKVKNITKFGAFVDFEGGQSGMVHISEISSGYVNEIRDFLSEGQMVKTKVISIGDDGKISLSIKQADPNFVPSQKKSRPAGGFKKDDRPKERKKYTPREPAPMPGKPGDFEWSSSSNEGGSFEDMMSKFKQRSEEKISELKKASDVGKGYSRKGRK